MSTCRRVGGCLNPEHCAAVRDCQEAPLPQPWPETAEARSARQAQELVAFEGMVEFSSWSMTSSQGNKVTFAVENREALAPFEKAVRRRGKRAGQRYRLILHDTNGDPVDYHPEELMFLGANWSTSKGAVITFTVGEAFDWFMTQPAADESETGQGRCWHMVLVEIMDDEQPVNQKKLTLVEEQPKPKGGPRSKAVAMRTQEPEFQAFVASCTEVSPSLVGPETCDRWIKRLCGVKSKIDFDHNEEAWEKYQVKVSSPYIRWGEKHYPGLRR